MPVAINFKICDNSKDCDGIKVCPTKAFQWDEEKKSIYINKKDCINCGKCGDSCHVDAIKFAKTEEEYNKVLKEIEEDPRTISDLFCERYGAQALQPEFLFEEEEFNGDMLNSKRPLMIEFFNDSSVMCLLKSIPVKELLQAYDKEATFFRIHVTKGDISKKYKVTEYPSLLFFKNKEVVLKIDGFVEDENKDELISKIKGMGK